MSEIIQTWLLVKENFILKVKHRIKLFFRDMPTTLLIIIGFTLSYFIAINGIALINTISSEQGKKKQTTYENEQVFSVDFCVPETYFIKNEAMYIKRIHDFLDKFDTEIGNLAINDYVGFVGDSMIPTRTNVILAENEDLGIKIVSGRLPSEEEIRDKTNVALISKEYKKNTVEKNGATFIRINEFYFSVIGYFETDIVTEDRRDIILFRNTFSDELMNQFVINLFEFYNTNIIYGSNVQDISTAYQDLSKIVNQSGYRIGEDLFKGSDPYINKKEKFNKMFLGVLLIFCLINCAVISNVWIRRRFQELVIRKTMGYSMRQIIWMLAVDLFGYGIISCILAIISQLIYSKFLNENVLQMKYFVQNSIYILGVMLVVILITLVIPMIQIRNVIPKRKIR